MGEGYVSQSETGTKESVNFLGIQNIKRSYLAV